MLKVGIYKFPSTNQRTFCYEICPPDYIKIWYEEPNEAPQDHWWDKEITPRKFHWLVDEYNAGYIAKLYPHWWEKVDTRKQHINSLLQLSHGELDEIFNYYSYVVPQSKWVGDNFLIPDLRPVWKDHKIVSYKTMTREEADAYNALKDAECYIGFSDQEILERKHKEIMEG